MAALQITDHKSQITKNQYYEEKIMLSTDNPDDACRLRAARTGANDLGRHRGHLVV
jgi:hypothetical protein